MTNLKTAVALVAWRNNGTVAPITVRFTQEKANVSGNFHSKMITRSLGIKSNTIQSVLLNYTEEMFDQDFSEYGFTADMIINGYRNEEGTITAHELNIDSALLEEGGFYISRYETTNTLEATNEDGSLKGGWSIKTVNGQELTHEGALIYSTFLFSEDGVDHKLQHDQDLRKTKSVEGISENSNVESKVESTTTESAPF
jgi:hypothetical protein